MLGPDTFLNKSVSQFSTALFPFIFFFLFLRVKLFKIFLAVDNNMEYE